MEGMEWKGEARMGKMTERQRGEVDGKEDKEGGKEERDGGGEGMEGRERGRK